jgi:hypothetical protein
MAARITRNILVVPTMYTLMSLNEYMTHRYFQHLEFNRPGNFMMLKNLLSRFTGKEPMDHKVPGDGHVEHGGGPGVPGTPFPVGPGSLIG